MSNSERLAEILQDFDFAGEIEASECPYGEGHINTTAYVQVKDKRGRVRPYIVQRINSYVFKRPWEVMDNIVRVTDYLRERIVAEGGDPKREILSIVPARDGRPWVQDGEGTYWRAYRFIEDTICLQKVDSTAVFQTAAEAFGRFMLRLSDFPAASLHEVIPNFHNTKQRLASFRKARQQNAADRAADCQAEIDFVEARAADCAVLIDLQEQGVLPVRVTHNDTKLNNVLIDRESGKGLCVIDLDTVMPGLAAYDFGDAIRFGASTGAEDERDLSKVRLDLALFEAYAEAYLALAGEVHDEAEVDSLAWGARIITLETGMRFLSDHLDGDVYFSIHRRNHNLDRARTQFKLVEEMEAHWDELLDIVRKAHARHRPVFH